MIESRVFRDGFRINLAWDDDDQDIFIDKSKLFFGERNIELTKHMNGFLATKTFSNGSKAYNSFKLPRRGEGILQIEYLRKSLEEDFMQYFSDNNK